MSIPAAVTQTASMKVRSSTWRLGHQEESLCLLSWMVAITASFLLIGVVGLVRQEPFMVITLSGAMGKGASEIASQDTTMAELQAMEEAPEINATEEVTPEVIEVPQVMDMPEAMPDLPELAQALITEDLFTIPAAPQIENALKPIDPAQPKPKPQPRPTVAKPRSSRATTTASGTPGGTQGNGGGGGGNGAVGSGGKGKFPSPPYPSFARARGMKGSVTLTVRVSPSGSVEAATVSGSTGFSELDSYAASWVRRNWRFPPGTARSFRLPIAFKLR